MGMTHASSRYFEENAGQWDSLRSGYFTEAVREAAIAKAYLRPEMVVADVGAGTGFMAAGLAQQVRQVYVFDGSEAMLETARKNLSAFDNIVYQEADGLSLPMPDGSLDAVFANMYLHHCPDPLAAIQEMARLLKPGSRLVITDMDAHEYAWMREEMADEWLGFEREQVSEWLEAAGLVNVIVGDTGQSCCSESQTMGAGERQAKIAVFVAAGSRRISGVQPAVQANYGELAKSGGGCGCATGQAEGAVSCCSPVQAESVSNSGSNSSCCGAPSQELISLDAVSSTVSPAISAAENSFPGYTVEDQRQAPPEAAEFSLGCGNPVALANLKPGEVVLDIGSGGGLDSFLAAQRVGPSGRVIGVDMTPEMLARARQSAEKAGLSQVEFRQGQAEALPVDDASIDVILSNCVINLTEDKGKVFREAYRALKPGGRLEVSDMVTDRAYPVSLRQNTEQWAGCVFGALPEQEYLDLVAQAGFKDITVRRSAEAAETEGVRLYSAVVSARKAEQARAVSSRFGCE